MFPTLYANPQPFTQATAQTVVNATVFLQIQQELQLIKRKIIPVGHSTAVSINPDTGKTETLTHRHPNNYSQKCFIFAIHKAFELFGDDLAKTCPSMQDTIPKIIEHFTTFANENTFLRNLVELLNSKNVLLSLMDIEKHPALLDWSESVDDENKTERLFLAVIEIFKNNLNDFKQKDTLLANEVTHHPPLLTLLQPKDKCDPY